jgi:hypothetical protein
MNPSLKSSADQPAGQTPSGCLVGGTIVVLLVLVLLTIALVVVFRKPANLMKYGLVQAMDQIDTQLARERTLPAEQYQELKIYAAAGRPLSPNRILMTARISRGPRLLYGLSVRLCGIT